MKTSRNGILFIACREAIVEVPYQDGKWLSIGCGHNGPDVEPGDRWPPHIALGRLKLDVVSREADVHRMLKVLVKQCEFDALVSLHYNRGNRNFPEVLALVNTGDMTALDLLFPALDTNKLGEHMPGLRTRRLAELAMFNDADYGALVSIPWYRDNPHTSTRYEYVIHDEDLR